MIKSDDQHANREGLVTVGVLPQVDAQAAILRSVPRITEAIRLTEKLVALLGDSVVHDVMAGEGNELLFLRDATDPRFVIPHPFFSLDVRVPAPAPILMAPIPWPEHLRPAERTEDSEGDQAPTLLPGPHRFPGKLRIAEGPAYLEISYGDDGTKSQTVQTAGDLWTWGYHHEDRPFAIDPFAKPAQQPPVSLYCRPDLDPAGHDLGVLASMVAAMDPGRIDRGRVHVPVATPGGTGGAWWRGLWRLREALWDGRIGEDEAGWAVIDAWSGVITAVGPTLPDAFADWQDAVRNAQPLPPREPVAPVQDEVPDVASSSDYDEETKTARFSTGTIHLVSVPRVLLDWPAARPENVPAIAVPLPPRSPIPEGWASYAFTRRVRLVGEYGDVCTAFVRDEGGGAFTLIGDGAIEALDPATLDAELDGIDIDVRRGIEERQFWIRGNPYTSPEYPWIVPGYRAWDDLGRAPQLRDGGISWSEEVCPRGFDADHMKWTITRVRRATGGPMAANRGF